MAAVRRPGLVVAALLMLVAAGDAGAGPFGSGVDGAVKGAILGDLIAGGEGAAAGAIAGGIVGARSGPSREEVYLAEQQAAADARLEQWEAERRARELKLLEERQRIEQIEARRTGQDDASR